MHHQNEDAGTMGADECGDAADEPPDDLCYGRVDKFQGNSYFGKLRADSGYESMESLYESMESLLSMDDDEDDFACDEYSSRCTRSLEDINKRYFSSDDHDEDYYEREFLDKIEANDSCLRKISSDCGYGSMESLLSNDNFYAEDDAEDAMHGEPQHEDIMPQDESAVSVTQSPCRDCGSPLYHSDVQFSFWEPHDEEKEQRPRRKISLPDRRGVKLEPLYIKRVLRVKMTTGSCTCEYSYVKKDEVDGAVGGEPAQPERGVMFERVADQLAAIADNYENLSPHSPADEGDASGFAARCIATVTPSLEGALGRMLRERGDQIADELGEQISPIVSQMVRHASYNSFSNVMTESLGQEPSWQQLALMFRLTKAAVALVGSGTEKALSIKDMTLQFFEDQFAGWVVTQGGWESMVEDTDLSSELD